MQRRIVENADRKVSGYSLYNPLIKQRQKTNPLMLSGVAFPPLPDHRFDIIYADPPWDYNGKTQFDKTLVQKENPNYDKNIFVSSASFKYPTIKTRELKTLPISRILKEDCLLFLWATNPHLEQAIILGNSWGFEYKTVAFVWNKQVHNPGRYTLSYCELCLLFKKGKIPSPRGARNVKQLINAPRKEHSVKPDEVVVGIEKMFPLQDKIELFARKKREGWRSWGIEI